MLAEKKKISFSLIENSYIGARIGANVIEKIRKYITKNKYFFFDLR